MYLSNRDAQWAIRRGQLIVEPPPEYFECGYDETSIDLHLDAASEAKVWDLAAFAKDQGASGGRPREGASTRAT